MTRVTGVFDDFFGPSSDTGRVYRSWMAECLAPVMYWAVHTTLCSALWSDAEQLIYLAVKGDHFGILISSSLLHYIIREEVS